METSGRPDQRGSVALAWPVLVIALARLAAHLLTGNDYGFHRDELATLSDSRNLAWGYVAYPPLTPFLGRIGMELFGIAPLAVRWISALAQAGVVVLTGMMARELGASRRAQGIAAAAVAIAPLSMLQGVMFQYVSFDMFWWTLLGWLAIRLSRSEDPRWWIAIGAVIGLAMMTKYSILFLVAGIVVGALAGRFRRHLFSRWLWLGVALSIAVFLPNLIWQMRHDFVSLEFLQHIHERDVRIGRTGGYLSGQFTTAANVFTVPLWLAGAWWLLIAGPGRRFRLPGLMWLVPLVLFALAEGRAYYMAGAYPVLLAAGATAWDRLCESRGAGVRRLLVAVTIASLVLGAAAISLIMLPLATPGTRLWHAAAAAHDNFAEQIGWDDLVTEVARIYASVPEDERAATAVLTGNYGEAGAVALLGSELGLPEPISGVNSFWYRGYGQSPQSAIVLGIDMTDATRMFRRCEVAGRNTNRYGIENEETRDHADILLCRDPVADWSRMWPYMRGFG